MLAQCSMRLPLGPEDQWVIEKSKRTFSLRNLELRYAPLVGIAMGQLAVGSGSTLTGNNEGPISQPAKSCDGQKH